MVDTPGRDAGDSRPGPHDPYTGAHDRDDKQASAHAEASRPEARPRASRIGARRRNRHDRGAGAHREEDGAAADFAAVQDRRQRRRPLRRLHPRYDERKSVRSYGRPPPQRAFERDSQHAFRPREKGCRLSFRAYRRLQPHARRSRQAFQRDARTHSSDRGESAP